MKVNRELYEECVSLYGQDIVNEAIEIVHLSDPDGAYTMFKDMGQYDHQEVVEILFFD